MTAALATPDKMKALLRWEYYACMLWLLSGTSRANNRNRDCFFSCESQHCPCNCYKDEIRCSGWNVTDIPLYPEYLTTHVLDLESNLIQEIKEGEFLQKSLKNLLGLRLSANKITEIRTRAFAGIPRLETLFLNHNRIKDLSENSFAGLHNLKRLYLNNNKIRTLPENVFEPLKKTLHLLYLHGNSIEHIPSKLLSDFKHLRTIDISRNKLTTIDGQFFDKAPSLEHIFLHGNPWSCDPWTLCSTLGKLTKIRKENKALQGNFYVRRKKRVRKDVTLHGGMVCASPIQHMGLSAEALIGRVKCEEVELSQYHNLVNSETKEEKTDNTENAGHRLKTLPQIFYYILYACLIIYKVV